MWIRQYPIPEGYKLAVDMQVQQWIDNGVVEKAPADCQWNLPLLAVKKPGKSGEPDGVRVCLDARKLNERTINMPDSSLPSLREIQDSLGQFEWISILDLADSYNQFEIRQEDRVKTAFTWNNFGQLMFRDVSFGLKIMTEHMQCHMELLLHKFRRKPFQDDIAIASESVEQHKLNVLEVLKAITYEAGLRLRIKKCRFFVKKARVLGSLITTDGIKMDPMKVKTVINWLKPVTGKMMQRFLDAVNFNRSFSTDFARLTAPLEEVKNFKTIVWTVELEKAFTDVKQLFASDLSLRTVIWSKLIYLTVDASMTGLGAWLGQTDDNNVLLPIICVSKKLGPTQQRWSATKRELYGLMWAMKKLRHYLLGRTFIARVDH